MWLRIELGTRQSQDKPSRGKSFFGGVIDDLCPYLQALLIDFIVSASLWLVLFVFNWLTHICPIRGFEGDTAKAMHSISTLLAFPALGVLFIVDVILINTSKTHRP
jgi:hypothetical protein